MAEKLIHLPENISPLLDDIKRKRITSCEPKTNRAIVVDAIKLMHKKVCKNDRD